LERKDEKDVTGNSKEWGEKTSEKGGPRQNKMGKQRKGATGRGALTEKPRGTL